MLSENFEFANKTMESQYFGSGVAAVALATLCYSNVDDDNTDDDGLDRNMDKMYTENTSFNQSTNDLVKTP